VDVRSIEVSEIDEEELLTKDSIELEDSEEIAEEAEIEE
jgi:hypothetical protein